MLYKIHSVAFSLLADFSNDMPFYWRFINWIPVALVFGNYILFLNMCNAKDTFVALSCKHVKQL